ncbi:kinase-like domain-containing protein [Rhizophagus diaphanus]|nr:kinase-like domain-containing protein [Rhizophagus diaphanus] [Rhizophagus sp. MUCL 43196]
MSGSKKIYGECIDCTRQRISLAWCKNCDIAFLKDNFHNWTSRNSKIDELIKYTQLNAKDSMDYLEWIDFDQFDLVEDINKRGAFSSIYSAVWTEGPRWNLDEETKIWSRTGPIKLYRYHNCLQSGTLADFFGITKDPTSCYMFVMRYYKNGNLYSYLEETMGILRWRDIVDMLWSISAGLNFIHKHGLVHGHLHGGNILVESNVISTDTKITDTGLHGLVDSKQISSKQIYGVIPFVAPEIFDGKTPTKESDVYSFGMVMWMLSAGVRPYCDRHHNKQLIQEICLGLRPGVVSGTPPVFSSLMLQCLDVNPSNRPTASQLDECLGNWVAICDDPDPSDLSNQFDAAEETNFSNLKNSNFNTFASHEKAFYFSRPLLDS